MRVIVLGAGGMLGHKIVQRLSRDFDVTGTLRGDGEPYRSAPVLAGARLRLGVSAEDLASVVAVLDAVRPAAVINCIGVIKQRESANDPVSAISVNALFPHLLARLCVERGVRLIHFSTDCVFSGRRGPYVETDVSDAEDVYGRTKFLGEIGGLGSLTLRTSIVGRELAGHAGLIDWFLAQRGGRIKGFTRALYSGLTTLAMADLVSVLLGRFPTLHGVRHVSGDAISKFELLTLVNLVYGLGVKIEREDTFFCDRRLDSSPFRAETEFRPAPWDRMIAELHADPTVYP